MVNLFQALTLSEYLMMLPHSPSIPLIVCKPLVVKSFNLLLLLQSINPWYCAITQIKN